jgi:uncharacterized protein (DUF169 family)
MTIEFRQQFISRWNQYFPGADLPIALFYSDELHGVEEARKYSGQHCMIADISGVFRGKATAFSDDNIGCGGGKRYCGFSDGLRPGFEFFLSYGIPGKMEGERYKKDPETVKTMMGSVPAAKAPAKYLIAKRFDQLEENDEPQIIVFFATPDVLAGLFTLANYDRSDLYGVKAPFCAGCGSIVQYPYLENLREEGDCILGMFDSSARPCIRPDRLSFAIPFKRFKTLLSYMDESFLITETWDVIKKRIQS